MSYVEYQAGNIADAEKSAHEASQLAHRLGAWFHFICAQSILYGIAVGIRDDHAAALWHAQQMELGRRTHGRSASSFVRT